MLYLIGILNLSFTWVLLGLQIQQWALFPVIPYTIHQPHLSSCTENVCAVFLQYPELQLAPMYCTIGL